jgi:hypothetical protein
MIIGSREIPLATWHKPVVNTDAAKEASLFSSTAPALPSQALSSKSETSTSSGSDSNQNFDEAFAKMMVNLKLATSNTVEGGVSPQATTNIINMDNSKGTIANDKILENSDDHLSLSPYQNSASAEKSATENFMDYMNQSDAEKAREQLTGVSKEEYEKMTPEEQASIDKKVAELTKEQAKIEQQVVRAKIAMAKAELA